MKQHSDTANQKACDMEQLSAATNQLAGDTEFVRNLIQSVTNRLRALSI